MGVERSDWIIIGVDIGTKYRNDDWYEMDDSPITKYDENSKVGEITYLYDGMGGKYFIVGEVIDADIDGYSGLGLTEIPLLDTSVLDEAKYRVINFINTNFGIVCEPKIIVLTHWA